MSTHVPLTAAQTQLAARLLDELPQTQCEHCGWPDCAAYARAIAAGKAPINQCPVGGAEGVRRLAMLTGHAPRPLDAARGAEQPRAVAWIDEAACIGCARCMPACPVDCIIGAPRRMHTVIEEECTGCGRCTPVCPVDCIHMEVVSGDATGWDAWSATQASAARARYAQAQERRAQQQRATVAAAAIAATTDGQIEARRAAIRAALERAQQKRSGR